MRGRNNFNGVISYLLTTELMSSATDVILSGGSAGGLAVFYNLDHLATLLPKTTRLTGFPDAGYFMDGAVQGSGGANFEYRNSFQGADPVWNVTGSGGTNKACLAANPPPNQWKCLLAQYIAPHIVTPIFVMNAAYDAWQMGNILHTKCVPTPTHACDAPTNASLILYRNAFVKSITTWMSSPLSQKQNGVFLDGCVSPLVSCDSRLSLVSLSRLSCLSISLYYMHYITSPLPFLSI
jgi:hypothetical protein